MTILYDVYFAFLDNSHSDQVVLPYIINDDVIDNDVSVAEILKKFSSEHRLVEKTLINVFRGDMWSCFLRMVKRPSFSPFKEPDVIFTDIDNISEGAIDVGGPRREFFRLLLDEVKGSVFEGILNLITVIR